MTNTFNHKSDEPKEVKVKIITLNNLILLGILKLPFLAHSYRSRLSDILNQGHDFIPLTDVQVFENQELLIETSFLCVNKDNIVLLTEEV